MKGYPNGSEVTGLIPLSVDFIFKSIQNSDRKFNISVSYIEIYNEAVNDLIEPANKNLDVRESISSGIYINKLSEKKVATFGEVMGYM